MLADWLIVHSYVIKYDGKSVILGPITPLYYRESYGQNYKFET
jgi:hypothetical protein